MIALTSLNKRQKVQTLTSRRVRDVAAGLGLHFLHMSECPFCCDAGHLSPTCKNVNLIKQNVYMSADTDMTPR